MVGKLQVAIWPAPHFIGNMSWEYEHPKFAPCIAPSIHHWIIATPPAPTPRLSGSQAGAQSSCNAPSMPPTWDMRTKPENCGNVWGKMPGKSMRYIGFLLGGKIAIHCGKLRYILQTKMWASWHSKSIYLNDTYWLVGGLNPSEKYASQFGWWNSQYRET